MQAGEDHRVEFQPLRFMNRHELNLVAVRAGVGSGKEFVQCRVEQREVQCAAVLECVQQSEVGVDIADVGG